MSRITLYTVPHTGTHFATKFFDTLGIEQCRLYKSTPKNTHWWRCHAAQGPSGDDSEIPDTAIISARKLVVTARDPYLSAIRYINPGKHRRIAKLQYRWSKFFTVLDNTKRDYFVLDIGCREKDRYQHLIDLADFTNIEYDANVVKEYAKLWKPENSTDTDAKAAYLHDGTLPELVCGGAWGMLDQAVGWYRNLPTNSVL